MQKLTRTRRTLLLAAATLTFAVHLAVVLIVSLGWLIPGLFYAYLILFAATLYSELVLKYCPLTRLEFGIRRMLDPAKAYDASCIMHYGRALLGLGPRPSPGKNPDSPFFKRHAFVFVLSGLFAASLAYRFLA